MAYFPISGTVPQYMKNATETASEFFLKGFIANSATPLSMGTDGIPTNTLVKCKLNSDGNPISDPLNETTEFIPYFNQSYKLSLFPTQVDADAGTNAVWTVDNIEGVFNASDIEYTSTATVKQKLDNLDVGDLADLKLLPSAQLVVGDSIRVTDDGVGGIFRVKSGNVTDNGGTLITFADAPTTKYAERLMSTNDAINVKWFGAKGDNSTNDTAAIQAAFDTLVLESVLLVPKGNYVITDAGGGVALDFSGFTNFQLDMYGTFRYTGTTIAVRFGFGGVRMWESRIRGLRVIRPFSSPYESGLAGTAIQIVNMGESTFKDCRVQGFEKGYALEPNADGEGVTIVNFYNINSQACKFNIYVEPGDFNNCFVTACKFYAGYQVTDQTQFTDIVAANAHLISIRNPFRLTRSANTVDGLTFNGMTIEQPVTRKIFCEGNSCHFINCYLDTGTYASGNTHASGIYPYRESGITGFTSAAGPTITKSSHGLGTFIGSGDIIQIDAAVDISDKRAYTVLSITTNTIVLNKSLSGTGALTIAHFSANIEFTATGNFNSITDCDTAGLQAISSRGQTAEEQNNRVISGHMGFTKGGFPPLGTTGSDTNPGGITDTPHSTLINMEDETLSGTGTMNVYLGNSNFQATDANTQLCFTAHDQNRRQQPFASIMANKEGWNASQPFGSLIIRTRSSGSGTFLIDACKFGSDQHVRPLKHLLVSNENAKTAFAGGGQANAFQITKAQTEFSTVANAGDSAKLPLLTSSLIGIEIWIFNNTANAMDIFPAAGQQIVGAAINAAVSLGAGAQIAYWVYNTQLLWKVVP